MWPPTQFDISIQWIVLRALALNASLFCIRLAHLIKHVVEDSSCIVLANALEEESRLEYEMKNDWIEGCYPLYGKLRKFAKKWEIL